MKVNVYTLLLTLALAALVVTTGCQRGNACGGNAKKCIGVTLLTREHVFYKDLEAGLREAAEKQGFATAFASEDAREGIGAFLAKRTPKFKGK